MRLMAAASCHPPRPRLDRSTETGMIVPFAARNGQNRAKMIERLPFDSVKKLARSQDNRLLSFRKDGFLKEQVSVQSIDSIKSAQRQV